MVIISISPIYRKANDALLCDVLRSSKRRPECLPTILTNFVSWELKPFRTSSSAESAPVARTGSSNSGMWMTGLTHSILTLLSVFDMLSSSNSPFSWRDQKDIGTDSSGEEHNNDGTVWGGSFPRVSIEMPMELGEDCSGYRSDDVGTMSRTLNEALPFPLSFSKLDGAEVDGTVWASAGSWLQKKKNICIQSYSVTVIVQPMSYNCFETYKATIEICKPQSMLHSRPFSTSQNLQKLMRLHRDNFCNRLIRDNSFSSHLLSWARHFIISRNICAFRILPTAWSNL